MIQPIETIPLSDSDGKEPLNLVLVWLADRSRWAFGYAVESTQGKKVIASGYYGETAITHWHPLPESPSPVRT